MSTFLEFASNNPFMTLFLSYIFLYFLVAAFNRILRTIKVLVRGWPTAPNMDADGDIVHPKRQEI